MVMRKPSVSIDDKRYTRLDVQNPFPGFYRARVELTRDPKKLGRVRIRIPQMHGFLPEEGGNLEGYFKTSELPWAMPGDFSCAGYDSGQFMVPQVGNYVWVSFEAGDPDRPIYFGGIPYKEGGQDKVYNHIGDVPDTENPDHPDYMGGEYSLGSDGSCPKDVYELDGSKRDTTEDITRQVLYKSVKGHAIIADDTDEKESFTFIDRIGQMLKFISPLTKDANKQNAEIRELRTAFNEDTLHSEDSELKDAKAIVLLKDIDNQIVRMVAEGGKDKIEIMSRDSELQRNSGGVFKSFENDVRFDVLAQDNDNQVYVEGTNADNKCHIYVVVGGVVVSHIKIDLEEGILAETLQKFKVTANEGIELNTKGKFEVYADEGINIESTNNVYIRGSNIHLNDIVGSAAELYVAGGGPDNWEDVHDEDYIKYGDGQGVQGGAGLNNWDEPLNTGGSAEGDEPPTEEELGEIEISGECQNAPRGGLRKSDTYLNNQSWRSEPHRGVDYAATKGTAITSTVKGKVVYSGYGSSYGNYVIVKEDGASRWHLYAHMASQCRVPINTLVNIGDVIGLLSNTGSVKSSGGDGSHVHYEVRTQSSYIKGGGTMNPSQWEGKLSS